MNEKVLFSRILTENEYFFQVSDPKYKSFPESLFLKITAHRLLEFFRMKTRNRQGNFDNSINQPRDHHLKRFLSSTGSVRKGRDNPLTIFLLRTVLSIHQLITYFVQINNQSRNINRLIA